MLPHIGLDVGIFHEATLLLLRLEGVVFGACFWYMEQVLGPKEDLVDILELAKSSNAMESMLHH